ncbi:MAG TPA: hypothetical protein VGZ26_03445, partial [Pirellulales bacterium]|nr:hypothetical protein [Pirellulales bacterium]
MSRMIAALKAIDGRQPADVATPGDADPIWPIPIAAALPEAAPAALKPASVHVEPEPISASMFEMCSLQTTSDVAEHYLELCDRIGEQLASNYCNVLLFVSASTEACFSMIELAQAFAL